MKTTKEVFKETLKELGFANHKPSQMTNCDYWLCTNIAMENYAKQFAVIVEEAINLPKGVEPHGWSDYKINKK
jgi:hypothetical protein